jgi:hypothetical protein
MPFYLLKRFEFIDAGIVNQNMQPTEGLLGFGEETRDLRFVGHTGFHGDGAAAVLGNLGNDEVSAFRSEVLGDGNSGYDCDFSFEFFHKVLSIFCGLVKG